MRSASVQGDILMAGGGHRHRFRVLAIKASTEKSGANATKRLPRRSSFAEADDQLRECTLTCIKVKLAQFARHTQMLRLCKLDNTVRIGDFGICTGLSIDIESI